MPLTRGNVRPRSRWVRRIRGDSRQFVGQTAGQRYARRWFLTARQRTYDGAHTTETRRPTLFFEGIGWGTLELFGRYPLVFTAMLAHAGQIADPGSQGRSAPPLRAPSDQGGRTPRRPRPRELLGLLDAGDPRGDVHAKEVVRAIYAQTDPVFLPSASNGSATTSKTSYARSSSAESAGDCCAERTRSPPGTWRTYRTRRPKRRTP